VLQGKKVASTDVENVSMNKIAKIIDGCLVCDYQVRNAILKVKPKHIGASSAIHALHFRQGRQDL
jgi:hypothetical protein